MLPFYMLYVFFLTTVECIIVLAGYQGRIKNLGHAKKTKKTEGQVQKKWPQTVYST